MAVPIGTVPRHTWDSLTPRRITARSGLPFWTLIALSALVALLSVWSGALLVVAAMTLAWVLPTHQAWPMLCVMLGVWLPTTFGDRGLSALPGAAAVSLCVLASGALGRRWSRTGVAPATGGRLLEDLRQRSATMCALPPAPEGWIVGAASVQAGGAAFGGDLTIGHRAGHCYDVVLADVSGVGAHAAPRAVLLSAAGSALLGAVERQDYLAHLNAHLADQDWHEGFATAVQVHLDDGGRFEVRAAGHPAAIVRRKCGEWTLLREASGTALGLLPGLTAADYAPVTGILEPGDALVLYSDGVVESSDANLLSGVQQLAYRCGEVAELCSQKAAAELAGRAGNDDKTVIVVRRAAA